MSDETTLQQLKEKLYRLLKAKAVLAERSKQLERQIEDSRRREDQTDHLVNELLERQREMNYMLHRATSFLSRIQEANTVLSAEFTELVKELPAPQAPDWEERVKKINELFKRTGALADEVRDEIFQRGLDVERRPSAAGATVQKDVEVAQPEVSESAHASSPPKLDPVPEPEAVIEPEPVEEVEEAEQHEVEHIEPNLQGRLDRLFRHTETATARPQLAESDDDEAAPSTSKPGMLSRLWRGITSWTKKNGKPEADADLPVDEGSVEFSDAPIEPPAKAQPEPDSQEKTSVECSSAHESEPNYLSELLEDTADEVEQISFDYIPSDAAGDQRSEPGEAVPSRSFWARLIEALRSERNHRTLLAIERAQTRRARRQNRRVRRPKPGGEAPAAS